MNYYNHEGIELPEIGDSPITSVAIPDTPTPYNPKGWGQRCDMDVIKHARVPSLGPDTWRPLPHDTFVDMIEQSFDRHGFTISEPLHYRSKSVKNDKIKDQGEYGRFNTSYGIAHPLLPIIDGVKWESGWLNSYDMTTSARGTLDKRTLICLNGMTVSDSLSNFRRKHTSGIDLNRDGLFQHIYDLVNNTVGSLVTIAQAEASRVDRYKQTECNDSDARWIIMESAKRNVIGSAATMKVLEHFETPEHPEFKDGSLMCLENAFTSDGRGRNIFTQRDRYDRLRSIIDTRFGFGESPNMTTGELATNF